MAEVTHKWGSFNNATLGFINRYTVGKRDSLGILDLTYAPYKQAQIIEEWETVDDPKLYPDFGSLYRPFPYKAEANTGKRIYLPYYEKISGNENVFICVAKKDFGNVGDVLLITYEYQASNGNQKSESIYAIIGKHMEDIDTSNPSVRGIGWEQGKEYIVSLVVEVEVSGKSWLDNIRERFLKGRQTIRPVT